MESVESGVEREDDRVSCHAAPRCTDSLQLLDELLHRGPDGVCQRRTRGVRRPSCHASGRHHLHTQLKMKNSETFERFWEV